MMSATVGAATPSSAAPGVAVSAIAPATGPTTGGTRVTITGTDFVASATVSVGSGACTIPTVANATTIGCPTPPGAVGAAGVIVTNPGQPASTLAGGFTYAAPAAGAAAVAPSQTVAVNPAFARGAPSADGADHRSFPETHHMLRAGFKQFRDARGGVAIFGPPIGGEFQEQSKTGGKTDTVQYFERNRFGYHPEFTDTPCGVELGLLGVQMTAGRSGEAPPGRSPPSRARRSSSLSGPPGTASPAGAGRCGKRPMG